MYTWLPYLPPPLADPVANPENPVLNPIPNCDVVINTASIKWQFFNPTKGTPSQGPKTQLIIPGRHPRYSIQPLADTWSPYLTLPDSLANTQNPAPNPVPNCYLLIDDSYIANQFFNPTKCTPFQGPKTQLINPPTTPRY